MSIMSDNPEWFDEWIFEKAIDGHFGDEIRLKAENGKIEAWDLWDLDRDGKLGSEACTAYCKRSVD